MGIDRVNIGNQGIDRSQAVQGTESVGNTGKDRKVPTGSDSVALSSKAKELDQLANSIDQSRTERFSKVNDALKSDTYQISARDVAQKLIAANTK